MAQGPIDPCHAGEMDTSQLLNLAAFGLRHLEFSAKDNIPETAGDTETIVEVSKVMLQMVLLELFVVGRKAIHCD